MFTREQWWAVKEAMKLLTPLQREALEAADTRELAKAKGISIATARQQRRRAIERLQALLLDITSWRVRILTST